MKRVLRAATKDYGVQIPAGSPVRGWMFWAIGVVLMAIGIGSLTGGQAVLGVVLLVSGTVLVLQTFLERSPLEP